MLADGALNKVMDDCSHAIEINREFAMPLLLRGQAYTRIGELEKTEEDFRDALDAAPNEEVAKEARRRLTALSRNTENRNDLLSSKGMR